MLRDVSFGPTDLVRPAPADWSKNLVTGRTYHLDEAGGSPVEAAVRTLVEQAPAGVPREQVLEPIDLGPTRGAHRLTPIRLGQGSFRAAIDLAYGERCAVTRNHVRPVLQAAHIRPVEHDGIHRVDNGLLLRADVHLMFDRGYLGVHPERHTLQVNPRLHSEFGNGEEFSARADTPIELPRQAPDRPSAEFLSWHMDTVFQT